MITSFCSVGSKPAKPRNHGRFGTKRLAPFTITNGVNQHSTVTNYPRPTVTHLQEGDRWGGTAAGPARRTIHPNPFYADHPWLPFLRCPMRRNCYSLRAGSNSDADSPLQGSSLQAFQHRQKRFHGCSISSILELTCGTLAPVNLKFGLQECGCGPF